MTIARRAFWAVLVLAAGVMGAEEGGRQRLVVDNQSKHAADVYRWQYNGNTGSWQLVKRVEPGMSVPVCDVREGARFRAIYGARYQQYIVRRPPERLKPGERPDVWVIRE